MVVLTDDSKDPTYMPTRANITKAIRWLVGDAHSGDSLWFSFSGHGSQRRCVVLIMHLYLIYRHFSPMAAG